MAVSAWPGSISLPALQALPFQPKTRPWESTARQKVAVGHETPVSPEASVPVTGCSVVMLRGAENTVPFQVMTAPLLSTSTQKLGLAQETALSWPWVSL